VPKAKTTTRPELLDNGVDDQRFRHLIYDILAFSQRLEEVRNGLGALMGLTGPQYSALIAIRMLDTENVSIRDIANYLHVSGAFVTSEVNKLIKLGLVSKVPNKQDRRRVSVSITPEGEKRLAELSVHQRPVNDTLFANITREEFLMLSEIFPRLIRQGDEAELYIDFLLKKNRPQLGGSQAS
jgi:MarR family transcriptional regulator, organic hydroperoxide resistance regulator